MQGGEFQGWRGLGQSVWCEKQRGPGLEEGVGKAEWDRRTGTALIC